MADHFLILTNIGYLKVGVIAMWTKQTIFHDEDTFTIIFFNMHNTAFKLTLLVSRNSILLVSL